MRPRSAAVLAASAAALLPACSPAFARDRPGAAPGASVVEARLTGVEDITDQPGAPCICDTHGNIMLDGSFRLTFSPLRTLAGPEVRTRLSYEQASARPIEGLRYLLVVAHEAAGDVIVSKGPSADGLCLESDEIKQYGLERAVREHRCRRHG